MAEQDRPRVVFIALVLLYVVWGLNGVLTLWNQALSATGVASGAGLAATVLIAMQGTFIFLLGRRKNWVRVLFLAGCLTSLPLSLWPILRSGNLGPLEVLDIGEAAALVVALALLFWPASGVWFRHPPTSSTRTLVLVVVLWVLWLAGFVAFYNIFSRKTEHAGALKHPLVGTGLVDTHCARVRGAPASVVAVITGPRRLALSEARREAAIMWAGRGDLAPQGQG
jgi:hypothetical protein